MSRAGDPGGDAPGNPLVEELARRTAICWLRYDGQDRGAWHAWVDDALVVVSGGEEQHLPGIEHASRVEVLMRSKDTGQRLLRWVGTASRLQPGDAHWEPVTAALVAGRLNLPDLDTAAATWATSSVVTRIVPTGEVLEAPGDLPDGSHQQPPRATPATTRGPLPRVLHRRSTRGPELR